MSIDLKLLTMREPQDFSIYIRESGIISLQSTKSWAEVDKMGIGVINRRSASSPAMRMTGDLEPINLNEIETLRLNSQVEKGNVAHRYNGRTKEQDLYEHYYTHHLARLMNPTQDYIGLGDTVWHLNKPHTVVKKTKTLVTAVTEERNMRVIPISDTTLVHPAFIHNYAEIEACKVIPIPGKVISIFNTPFDYNFLDTSKPVDDPDITITQAVDGNKTTLTVTSRRFKGNPFVYFVVYTNNFMTELILKGK